VRPHRDSDRPATIHERYGDPVAATELIELVRAAHGDAWEVQGRLRAPFGGGAARVRGARLMASGIPRAKWNNADVTDADVDLEAVNAWYASRDLPWGMRVPLGLAVELGTPLFVKRCMGILPDAFPGDAAHSSVRTRRADARDLPAYAALDLAIFGGDIAESRAWIGPELGAPGFRLWLAELDGMPVGVATTVRSNGEAGPAAYLCGLGALPGAPGRTVLDALATTAVTDAFDAGAAFVHANPDDDAAADQLAAHGATEVPGFLVRLVRSE
jgi:hypothetical protein